jgi:hypothetical protein
VRVAFDVDGVLRDLMRAYVPLVGHTLDDLTTHDKAIRLAGGLDQFNELLDSRACWTEARPYTHLLGLCKCVEAAGHTILIATAVQTEAGRKGTLDWLYVNDVNYDELHFCVDKMRVHFDAIVEDDPKMAYAAASSGRAAFLVNRPWTNGDWRHPNLFKLPEDAEAVNMVMDVLDGRSSG